MSVVAVTGSAGLVGRSLRDYAENSHVLIDGSKPKWVFLTRADCDVRDAAALESVLKRVKATHVIHLAAVVGGIVFNMTHQVETLRDNTLMATAVLEACSRCGVRKLLSVLSTCCFPVAHQEHFTEGHFLDGKPEVTNEGYAHAKRLLFSLSKAYSAQHGLHAVCVIPPNLYGPYDKFCTEKGHVIGSLVMKAFESVRSGSLEIRAFGDGTPRRQFMFAPDFAEAVVWALKEYDDAKEPLIVGPPGDVEISEVARVIAENVDPRIKVVWDESMPNGQMRKYGDPSKYLRLRPGASFTPFSEGIAKTVAWYSSNMSTPAAAPAHVDKTLSFPLCDDRLAVEDRMAAIELLATDAKLSMGPLVEKLEQKFAQFSDAGTCVFVNSGSSANLLMMNALRFHYKLEVGSKIFLPAVCWSTSVWPIVQLGFVPVFVDVDTETLQLDLRDLEKKAEAHPDARAVLTVHVLGGCCDMHQLVALCAKHNLLLCEDACEVMGNKFDGVALGTWGELGSFSTYYSHHMCTIEGGFVAARDASLRNVLVSMRAHGWTRGTALKVDAANIDPRFLFVTPGFNLRNTELAAAIGLRQLQRLPEMNRSRVANMRALRLRLQALQQDAVLVSVPDDPPSAAPVAWLSVPLLTASNVDTAKMKSLLAEMQVESRPIISGNFLRQPGMAPVDGLKQRAEDFPGAEHVHFHGLYVGLSVAPWSPGAVEQLCARLVNAAKSSIVSSPGK